MTNTLAWCEVVVRLLQLLVILMDRTDVVLDLLSVLALRLAIKVRTHASYILKLRTQNSLVLPSHDLLLHLAEVEHLLRRRYRRW